MSDGMDWSDLAEQSLPALASSTFGVDRWNQSVPELPAPAGSLLSNTAATNIIFNNNINYNNNMQESTAFRNLQNLSMRNAPAETNEPAFMRLEDRIAHSQQSIINEILQHTAEDTRRQIDARVEDMLQRAWKRDRDMWVNDLVGTRFMGSAANPGNTLSLQESTRQQLTVQGASKAPLQLSKQPSRQNTRLDPTTVQKHLQIVTQHPTPEQFMTLSGATSSDALYYSAWQLLSRLARNNYKNNPIDQAMACLVHLCRQYAFRAIRRVRQSPTTQTSIMYANHMANTLASYVTLTLGDCGQDIWPLAYTCLRCGDALAALDVLERTPTTEACVMRIVGAMAKAQNTYECLWEGEPALIEPADRQAVADLLEAAKNREKSNIYEIGFYALCSAETLIPSSDNVLGFKTFEDYLTSSLWKALFSSQPMDELIMLGEVVQNYGPGYFEDENAGGWAFAIPLLTTQQYERALIFLSDAGGRVGLMQAVHLGMVLSDAGIPIRDLGLNDAVINALDDLLVEYADCLLSESSAGARAALEYLVRIPNKSRACKEAASLIAKTCTATTLPSLAGETNSEGVRCGGALLDKHFSPEEVASILATAGDELFSSAERVKIGLAAMCYMLAGRFADVLSLLNQVLSPPYKADPDRTFWIEQTENFHTCYLEKRTQVMKKLETEQKLQSVSTSRTMLNLNKFFKLLNENCFDEAMFVADSLNILPISQSDRLSKEREFQFLDPLVKASAPALIVGFVKALHQEHLRLNLGAHLGASLRLRQIQDKVRLITTFASLSGLQMTSDQIETLNRFESLMV
jgi:hypothetical protein